MSANIYKATIADIPKIIAIADKVWVAHYSKIISQEQIEYMYALMYSANALSQQMQDGHSFFIYEENEIPLGFVSMKADKDIVKIPKLYVSIEAQGKGIGKKLVEKIISEAKSQHAISVQLNVNRFNTESIAFYKKVGFQIIETIDIPLDKFLLEDYVMNFEL